MWASLNIHLPEYLPYVLSPLPAPSSDEWAFDQFLFFVSYSHPPSPAERAIVMNDDVGQTLRLTNRPEAGSCGGIWWTSDDGIRPKCAQQERGELSVGLVIQVMHRDAAKPFKQVETKAAAEIDETPQREVHDLVTFKPSSQCARRIQGDLCKDLVCISLCANDLHRIVSHFGVRLPIAQRRMTNPTNLL